VLHPETSPGQHIPQDLLKEFGRAASWADMTDPRQVVQAEILAAVTDHPLVVEGTLGFG